MRRGVIIALVVGLYVVATPASAEPKHELEVEVEVEAEAWYHTSPLPPRDDEACPGPLLCDAVVVPSANPYPEGTLHVAATAGRETARTYLRLDLDVLAVPPHALREDATLHLPVAGFGSGTFAADVATVDVCLVAAPFVEAYGASSAHAPPVDCTTTRAATFRAEGQAFAVDLDAFLDRWSAGASPHGLALIARARGGDTWHVALEGRGPGDRRILARLRFRRDPPLPAPSPPTPAHTDPLVSGGATPASQALATPPPHRAAQAELPPLLPAPARILPTARPTPALPPPPVAVPPPRPVAPAPAGAAHPAAWLLPLILLGTASVLARSLTQEMALPPLEAPSSA